VFNVKQRKNLEEIVKRNRKAARTRKRLKESRKVETGTIKVWMK